MLVNPSTSAATSSPEITPAVVKSILSSQLPMRTQPLQLQGVTRIHRPEATERVQEAIRSSGGWILDYQSLSSISLFLRLRIPVTGIGSLYTALLEAGLQLSPEISEFVRQLPAESTGMDLPATLQITFVNSPPPRSSPMPVVPG